MERYTIEATASTPSINFDLKSGVLEIKGRSIPENSIEFYLPLFSALDKYVCNAQSVIAVTIQLEYYNSSSSACIFNVLKKLEAINKGGCKVTVNWLYEEEDEDTLTAGKNYQTIISLPFQMIQVAG
jgi:hypothetical protein